METQPVTAGPVEPKRGISTGRIVLLVVLVAIVASAATVWVITRYVFPREFAPVHLSEREQRVLNEKLERVEATTLGRPRAGPAEAGGGEKPLEPERYSEAGATREIAFTERELNALLARNTDLARKLAVDLSQDMASAKLLIPLDPEFPILGGKTLKVTAGLELRYADRRPVVALTGVSVWGVPIPNAWLGGLKHVDLVGEFGGQEGFWKSFAAGIEHVQVTDGQVVIKLKE
jgi:hypothetical protein